MSVFNAYVISLSKYVNTGIVAVFTILAWLGVAVDSERVRHTISIFQKLLLTAFLINANMTIAWVVRGRNGRLICLLCAMEILFMLAFMVLYRIVHERANMLFFNNLCMLLSIGFVMISRIASPFVSDPYAPPWQWSPSSTSSTSYSSDNASFIANRPA